MTVQNYQHNLQALEQENQHLREQLQQSERQLTLLHNRNQSLQQSEQEFRQKCTQLEATLTAAHTEILAALHKSEARFKQLAANVPGAIYQFKLAPDGTGTVPYISSGCLDLYEVSPEAVYATGADLLLDMIHPEDRPSFDRTVAVSAETLEPWRWEGRFLLPSGKLKWIQGASRPERQADGSVVWDGLVMDITQRKQTEIALQQLNQQLETSVEERTEELSASKARLQRLAANVPGMLFQAQLEADGSITFPYASARCWDLFELDPSEADQLFDLIPVEDRVSIAETLQRSIQTLDRFEYEHRIITRSGQMKWVHAIAQPERTRNGTIVWEGIVIDISDRKQVEAELRYSQQCLARLIEQSPVGILEWNQDCEITQWNPAAEQIFGYPQSEIIGRHFKLIVPPELHEYVDGVSTDILAQSGGTVSINENVTKAGETITCEWHNNPLVDVNGDVVGAASMVFDISERTRVETERKRQEEALRLIVEGTASATGAAFFRACVQYLARVLQVQYAFIAEIDDTENRVRTLAFWAKDDFRENIEYDLTGTPCNTIYQEKSLRWYSHGIKTLFPEDANLIDLEAESHAGIPIRDTHGNLLGHLAVLDTQPMLQDEKGQSFILEIFAARAGAEIERMRAEKALQQSTERLGQKAKREQLLNCLTSQIRSSLDFGTIQDTIVQEMRQVLNIDRCHFAWYYPDAEEPYWDVVSESRHPDLLDLIGRYPVAAFGPLSELVIRQQIVRVDNVDTIQDLAVQQYLRDLGNRSLLVMPLRSHAGAIGILACIHSQNIRPWSNEEVALLQAVMVQLTIAINQAELYRQSLAKTEELQQTLVQLQRTQTQLIQSEKMSSLGQLVAGVAHEINNPVNFIYANIDPAAEYVQDLLSLLQHYQHHYPTPHPAIIEASTAIDLDFLQTDLPKLLASMKLGADRIRQIVLSLRLFSRLDEAEVKAVDIHAGLDSTLMILQSRLKPKPDSSGIQTLKEYGHLPLVECHAGQLNQVFMNLLVNAIDALEQSADTAANQSEQPNPPAHLPTDPPAHPPTSTPVPTIWICTEATEAEIVIRIRDNGPGISETLKQRIFDPFFTTKDIGQGTGLGLSISHQIIVDKHQGQLDCHSIPGEGTEFTIAIPQKRSGHTS